MNALLAALAVALGAAVALVAHGGAAAVLLCMGCALLAGLGVAHAGEPRRFLLQIFVAGLLLRCLVGTLIYFFELQVFFGGDALTYDQFGESLHASWQGDPYGGGFASDWARSGGGWGMLYLVAAVYWVVGRNMLAVQFFNAVLGAATAPVVFLCARHIFQNLRVAKLAAFSVAFYPSLVLWSSQGLKDGPIVFLLAVSMLMTLRLGERLNARHLSILVLSLFALLTLRFYIFYMVVAAIVGAFVIGMRQFSTQTLARQFVMVAAMGLAFMYFGVLRTSGPQLENFANLQAVQMSRSDLAVSAKSGFGQDVDVSTAGGALSVIPTGMAYLLFAPFPWQVANLRQSITIPEMVVWWASFPLMMLGLWFTLKFRMRQALPILIFTSMLTLAYSVFQGNVGTAYRQRSQVLVFYFIFVAVGVVLLKERQENRERAAKAVKTEATEQWRELAARRRYDNWKLNQEKELEGFARDLSEKVNF